MCAHSHSKTICFAILIIGVLGVFEATIFGAAKDSSEQVDIPIVPTTTDTTQEQHEALLDALCDVYGKQLELALRRATKTMEPLTFKAFLFHLIEKYIMVWHPHFFLRRLAKTLYFAFASAAPKTMP